MDLGDAPSLSATRLRRPHSAPGGSVAMLMFVALLAPGLSCTSQSESPHAKDPVPASVGDPHNGRGLVERFGCGSCHAIPGVADAQGRVGPPLGGIAKRTYVGGALPNVPSNMIAWIRHPQRIDPATAMPDLGLTDSDARDVAAYLYTLK